jgi:hypothetical protein
VEAKNIAIASKVLSGLQSKKDTNRSKDDSKNEMGIDEIPKIIATSELIQDGSKDISEILPQRLKHVQPIIEEESRIDHMQEKNNEDMDENRAELDDNMGKISTKAFLNQNPQLAKLGEDVKKVINNLHKKTI